MKIINKSIHMLASFDEAGVINPVKFKIQNEDESKIVKVDRIIAKHLEKLAGNRMWVFRCQSVIDGVEKIMEIKYELDTGKWILFKI